MNVDDSPAVRKCLAVVRPVCAALPGSEEYVMVHHPAFRVGKKPFAIVGLHADAKRGALSLNLGREAQAMLLDDARFLQTPYIGRHGWVTADFTTLAPGELRQLVEDSWRRVAGAKQLAAYGGPSVKTAKKASTPKKKTTPKRTSAKPRATARRPR